MTTEAWADQLRRQCAPGAPGVCPSSGAATSAATGAADEHGFAPNSVRFPPPYRRLLACCVAGWQPAEAPHFFRRFRHHDALPAASRRHSRLPVCATIRMTTEAWADQLRRQCAPGAPGVCPSSGAATSAATGAADEHGFAPNSVRFPPPYRRLLACCVAGWQPAEAPHFSGRFRHHDTLPAASRRHSRLPVCATFTSLRPGTAALRARRTTCLEAFARTSVEARTNLPARPRASCR